MNATRVIRLAVPGWAALRRGLEATAGRPDLPALEWLLARGRSTPADDAHWRRWVLAGTPLPAELLERFPAGPCSVAPDRDGTTPGTWARVEPVQLLAALDHLELAAPVPVALDPPEAQALLEALDAHLQGTGFSLQGAAGDGWLCRCPDDLECTTADPWNAVGRNLREWLPGGRDARRVQALLTELQMLLHDHPVNGRRAARGLPVVNSLWLWGVGRAQQPAAATSGTLATDDAWLAGLWRLHGGRTLPPPQLDVLLDEIEGDVHCAVAPGRWTGPAADEVRRLDEQYFAPARAALRAGRVRRVELHLGDRTTTLHARDRWAFWRRPRAGGETP
jgi:hypothetical protein